LKRREGHLETSRYEALETTRKIWKNICSLALIPLPSRLVPTVITSRKFIFFKKKKPLARLFSKKIKNIK
jgi:hypothetical protein